MDFENDEQKKLAAMKRHPKLSFDDLITELEKKGISFNEESRKKAIETLTDLNYYYKITVYRRNFQKYNGRYKDLQFSTLADIASVDMQFRYLLLTATLDIEHAMKTFLVTMITDNDEIDGYDIVERFFHSTLGTSYILSKEVVFEKVKNKSHYQRKLYEAHKDAIPAWVLVEIMNFGEFLRFFEFYFKKYPHDDFDIAVLSGVLNSVKRIRNCAAHNNAFLFHLASGKLPHISKYIHDYSKKAQIDKVFYKCTKVHDVICVIFAHDFFVKGIGSRIYRRSEFEKLVDKSLERFHYLDFSNDLIYFFKVIKSALKNYKVLDS